MTMVSEIGAAAVRISPEPSALASVRHVGQGFLRRGRAFRQAPQGGLVVNSIRTTDIGEGALESVVSNGHVNPVSSSGYVP